VLTKEWRFTLSNRSDEFIRFLIETTALRFGDFTLKSGQKSPFFIDLGNVVNGRDLSYLGESLAGLIDDEFGEVDVLFGPAYKGIVLAAATSIAYSRDFGKEIPICYNRKEAKDHGETGSFIGAHPKPGQAVVIVDDVISSGGTKFEAADSIERAFGVKPLGVAVGVDRIRKGEEDIRERIRIESVIGLDDICTYLKESSHEKAGEVIDFYEGRI
jgi:orotate phosphoribosyltransferase